MTAVVLVGWWQSESVTFVCADCVRPGDDEDHPVYAPADPSKDTTPAVLHCTRCPRDVWVPAVWTRPDKT